MPRCTAAPTGSPVRPSPHPHPLRTRKRVPTRIWTSLSQHLARHREHRPPIIRQHPSHDRLSGHQKVDISISRPSQNTHNSVFPLLNVLRFDLVSISGPPQSASGWAGGWVGFRTLPSYSSPRKCFLLLSSRSYSKATAVLR